jgi:hypothetical protein|eukprot:gnl/Ergobibamus_cyprinoides/1069.p1 GENE.gnl/Ergobibamus_cyprinoides/1069~~gnl/Ergobibamus_cyprinoides/1069.p1  ORF type:complete len:222 (+),score=52.89 gnl/Ergobibamus_cyprinoides/1069:36-668(+)
MAPALLSFCLALLCFIGLASALSFDLAAGDIFCFSEDIPEDTFVLVKYGADESDEPISVDLKVIDPTGALLFNQAGISTGQFAFTSHLAGDHRFCYSARLLPRTPRVPGMQRRASIVLSFGAEGQDWDAVATADQLLPLEVDLRRMEDHVRGIHRDQLYMRRREDRLATMTEATSRSYVRTTLFVIFVAISTVVGQTYAYRRFFKAQRIV